MDEMKGMQDAQRELESKLLAANEKHSELNEYVIQCLVLTNR